MQNRYTTALGVCLLLFFGGAVHAQAQKTVEGTVTDAETGEALPSVNIRVEGTTTGTTTDPEGRYRISVFGPDAVLVFSFVGYGRQEIKVGDRATIDVEMKPKRGALEDVVVTAQRREERIQDVPVSVATASQEEVAAVQSPGSDIRDLKARVPSLNAEGSNGNIQPRFYIRGMGNTDFDINASQPVVLMVDGVVQENVLLKSQMLFDVKQIEVQRGPQGSLFGRNTPAGIVQIKTRKPTWDPDGYASATYSRFNGMQFEGAVSGSIIPDLLAARVAGRFQHRGDWIDNEAPTPAGPRSEELGRLNDLGGRVQFRFTPSARLNGLLRFHARSFDGPSEIFRANIIKPGGGFVDDFERDEVFHDGRNDQGLNLRGASLNWDYNFGPVTLTSITGYEHAEKKLGVGDIDGGYGAAFLGDGNTSGPGTIPFPSETGSTAPDLDQWTQEVRVSSNELGRVDFQGGFFYFNDDLKVRNFSFDSLNESALNGRARQRQETKSWAFFGHVETDLTENLHLSGGARFTSEEKDFVAARSLTPPTGPPNDLPPTSRNLEDEVVSWDANLRYEVNSNVSVYTRIAKGFRGPSVQGRVTFANAVTTANSETMLSYEGGVKSSFFDRRVQFNLTGYFYDMDDQQLTAVGGDVNTARLLNAEDTDGYGFEMDGKWSVTENLRFTAGASYNFTQINDEDLRVPLPASIANCEACSVEDPVVQQDGNSFVRVDGNPLPQAPRWIANWTVRYDQPVGDETTIFAFTDWALNSPENFFLYEAPEFRNETVVTGGLRVGASFNDGQYEFAVFGRNITNELALEGAIDFNNRTGFVNDPPLWGVELTTNL
jgi:iron complex outermembrane receptor protein